MDAFYSPLFLLAKRDIFNTGFLAVAFPNTWASNENSNLEQASSLLCDFSANRCGTSAIFSLYRVSGVTVIKLDRQAHVRYIIRKENVKERRCGSLEQMYNKAVRDKIPAIIEASGKRYKAVTFSNAQFLSELEKKLSEEVDEYQESKNIEELADILEVIFRIVELKGSSTDALEAIRKKKLAERGGFKKNLFLVKTY